VSGRGFRLREAVSFQVVLILDFVEMVREIPLGSGPVDRKERGKHSRRCQSSSAFEDVAFIDEFAQS